MKILILIILSMSLCFSKDIVLTNMYNGKLYGYVNSGGSIVSLMDSAFRNPVAQLKRGEKVIIDKEQGNFFYVKAVNNTLSGYIAKNYVQISTCISNKYYNKTKTGVVVDNIHNQTEIPTFIKAGEMDRAESFKRMEEVYIIGSDDFGPGYINVVSTKNIKKTGWVAKGFVKY